MADTLLIAIIAGSSAVAGGLVTGILSLLGSKISADREDRRRREENERQTARERLEKLYEPLLKTMTPGPPYDEFRFDRQVQRWIIEKIEKAEVYASPNLLNVFYRFRYAHYNDPEKIDGGLGVCRTCRPIHNEGRISEP